jgi:hypothetical protein
MSQVLTHFPPLLMLLIATSLEISGDSMSEWRSTVM